MLNPITQAALQHQSLETNQTEPWPSFHACLTQTLKTDAVSCLAATAHESHVLLIARVHGHTLAQEGCLSARALAVGRAPSAHAALHRHVRGLDAPSAAQHLLFRNCTTAQAHLHARQPVSTSVSGSTRATALKPSHLNGCLTRYPAGQRQRLQTHPVGERKIAFDSTRQAPTGSLEPGTDSPFARVSLPPPLPSPERRMLPLSCYSHRTLQWPITHQNRSMPLEHAPFPNSEPTPAIPEQPQARQTCSCAP
ncbi:hypothetical protein IWX90DRAFT_158355 [Phyllosticta citrichinensis]|uniref:Uncharacterized protein n=1 Tax=Phyllosticta citrichinensis TaxID=1130410 RepID=A0ABR1Y030_9PEZI